MKNFLSKLWSLSRTDRVRTLAIDAVSLPSFCRVNMLKLVYVLVLILTIGSGNVWGAESVVYTLNTDTTGGSNGYATLSEDISITNHDKKIVWNAVGNTTMSPWRIGGKKITSEVRPVYSETAISENITKVVVSYGEHFDLTSASAVLKVYSTAADAASGSASNLISTVSGNDGGKTPSNAIAKSATHTFTRPAGHDWKGRYFRFEFSCTYTPNSNKYFELSSADFYADVSSCEKIGAPSVTATPGDRQISLSWPNQSEANSYTVTCTGGTPGAVTGTTTKSCTITGLTNGTSYTWTVTPVGDGSTYCTDGNTAASASATPNVYYTVTWKNNGSSYTTTSVASGQKPTFPDNPSSCDGTSTTFYGWSTSEWSGTVDALGGKTVYTAASSMPTVSAAVSYYAVFAKKTTGSETSVTGGTFSDAVTTQTGWTGSGVGTYSGNGVKFDGANDYIQSPDISSNSLKEVTVKYKAGHNGGSGSVLTFASLDGSGNVIDSKTATPSQAYNSQTTTYSLTLSGASIIKYVRVTMTSKTNNLGMKYCQIYYTPVTYSKYLTTCCTGLGSINGSVSWSNAATAVVSWDNLDHVSSWTVKYKTHAAGAYTTWAGEQSTAAGRRSVTITGLTPCTNYDFQIIANPASGYCDKDQTIEDSQTHNWTVTSTGVTNATASPAIPSTTCSGFSTTISPTTGYALPADITVTNATKSWNSSTGALSISSVTGNVSITITPTCVSPVVTADPADADYYVGDAPTALSVTATLASGTRTYLWKVSTNGGSTWSDATGTNNTSSYSGASLSTASVGTLKFKCIVGNSEGGCTVESEEATITVANASYFPNGKTIFIQAESSSAWSDANYDCVKAWFHTAGGSETAQTTYWLFDATGGDAGKKLFATVVPATGDLPYLDIQRFTHDCSSWRNKNGGCSYSDANGSNTIRSTGNTDTYDAKDDYIHWNVSGVTIDLYGDPSNDEWASSLASFSDQGAGVWTATYENYAPANAAGESQDFKAKTNYNGWIGNTGSNNNATLDGMHVGSTYDVTATLDIKDHSLEMSKTFVKGTVHFDLQGHGLAISDLTNVTAGSKISAPSAPSATGYTFGGWYKEPACTNAWTFASDEVNETMTLYAKWTANVYTITKTLTNVANAGLPASFTYTGSTTTALNSTFAVDATNFFLPSSIAVTMGGTPLTAGTDYTYNNSTGAFTFSAVITGDIVITATATAKLKSIAITTQPTSCKYFAGESFSSTGAVVTATMGDGSTKAVTASTTWTPSGALSAGTGQTVTASYTEGGINQTATTTIDVYSVTVNKKNEDGDAVDVAGVTATWTVGSKTLAEGVGSTKYVFKQWEVTGASIGSTSSANTTLSNPTANVVVNAVFWKPRTVKWSVNGNDSYASSETVAYNGTISTVPSDPSGLACAGTFVAWTDAAHNNGQTAKDDDSYYESKLFTDAGDFPNITAETTTFYAVFAEGGGAAVNTVMWGETWTDATVSNGNSGQSDANPDDNCSTTKGTTIYGAASISYTQSDNSIVYCRNENSAGGTAPELYIKSSNSWTISGIPTGGAATLSLTYATNKTPTVTVSTTELGKTPTISGANKDKTITTDGASTITIQFSTSENTRVDNVELRVATVSLTNYVTQCDANIVKVTYNANGGSTSCTNTTTDKTEDFTVCSTEPTRAYYTFAGWLCSADDEVYAASATIDADAIDADFTLTAQWTPLPYSITYNYNGGSAQVDPAPATSYTVESSEITLQTPTKGHDRFDGWYENADLSTGGVKTTIPAGSHENKTYYAKWATRHEIIFDADGATTTIYRADDENLEDDVAGMGSVPDDPDAPSACSSKVFVGWSESTIDDETDTEPADLFDGTGAVDEDKHYYAVWATSTSGSKTLVMEITRADFDDSYHSGAEQSHTSTAVANDGSGATLNVSWKSVNVGDFSSKIQVKDASGAGFWNTTDLGSISSVSITTGNNITHFENTSVHPTSTSGTTKGYFTVTKSGGTGTATKVTVTFTKTVSYYIAYSTSCCATKVTLSEAAISGTGATIMFDKVSPVATCDGSKTVTATVTVTAGYQVTELSFSGGSVNVSPAISTPLTSSQNYTLTFAEGTNATLTTTATVSAKPLNSITITPSSGEVYVGQYADFTVSYDPADYLSPGYTLKATPVYVAKEAATPANTKLRLKGGRASGPGASITETVNETVTIQASGDNTKTASVNITVNPLPRVHFEDLVHGKEFADVVATLSENALNPNKTTKTSVDWTTPNANTCEENHLHLVGWIRSDWPALVAYLNGTGDAPTTTAIVGAGNDGSGNAYFFAPNASINVLTFNGATFYAVWAEIK
jgi:uncharacterized repeat protein (TIGR02543 family)